MIETIIAVLEGQRFDLSSEKGLQAQIAGILSEHGVSFEREYRLGDRDIVDFYIEGTAIEIKIKGSPNSIYRQCERYCGFDSVKRFILATNRSMGFPDQINGKPAYYFNLGRGHL